MPKSGQAWDPEFLRGHPLFSLWEEYASRFRGPTWPRVEDYTGALRECSERAEAADAMTVRSLPPVERVAEAEAGDSLPSLVFRRSQKRSRRRKRTEIDVASLYDGSIALSGEVLCLEESYHDLLNAIVFCAFPRSKRVLHRRQYRALSAWLEETGALSAGARLPGTRSREQDALTIFDEGGTLVLMTEAVLENLRETGQPLQVSAAGSPQVVPLLFGHGLLEQLLKSPLAVRSSGYVLTVSSQVLLGQLPHALFELADRGLARRLSDPKEFCFPRADVIFELDAQGDAWIRLPRAPRTAPGSSV